MFNSNSIPFPDQFGKIDWFYYSILVSIKTKLILFWQIKFYVCQTEFKGSPNSLPPNWSGKGINPKYYWISCEKNALYGMIIYTKTAQKKHNPPALIEHHTFSHNQSIRPKIQKYNKNINNNT